MDMSWLQYVGDVGVTGALVVLIVMVFRQRKRDSEPSQHIVGLVDKTVTRMAEQYQRLIDIQIENAELVRVSQATQFREQSEMQLQAVTASLELTQAIMALKAEVATNTVIVKAHRADSAAAFEGLGEKIAQAHKTTRQVVYDNHIETRNIIKRGLQGGLGGQR